MNEVLAMMGRQSPYQYKFFMKGFSLEKRVRKDHVLRRISEEVDFDFILSRFWDQSAYSFPRRGPAGFGPEGRYFPEGGFRL
jgi:hypothetical protein